MVGVFTLQTIQAIGLLENLAADIIGARPEISLLPTSGRVGTHSKPPPPKKLSTPSFPAANPVNKQNMSDRN